MGAFSEATGIDFRLGLEVSLSLEAPLRCAEDEVAFLLADGAQALPLRVDFVTRGSFTGGGGFFKGIGVGTSSTLACEESRTISSLVRSLSLRVDSLDVGVESDSTLDDEGSRVTLPFLLADGAASRFGAPDCTSPEEVSTLGLVSSGRADGSIEASTGGAWGIGTRMPYESFRALTVPIFEFSLKASNGRTTELVTVPARPNCRRLLTVAQPHVLLTGPLQRVDSARFILVPLHERDVLQPNHCLADFIARSRPECGLSRDSE